MESVKEKSEIKVIDLNYSEIKKAYRTSQKITINNIVYGIGLICGAINEFRLYYKGKELIVHTNKKDITFIITN